MLVLLLLLLLGIVGGVEQIHYDNAWDTVPENLSEYSPGDVIKSRLGSDTLSNADDEYELMYRTTDGRGNAAAAYTRIYIPEEPKWDQLVSLQTDIGSAASYDVCDYFNGADIYETLRYNLLSKHWLLLSPEYFGVENRYGANILGANAILDSIRAAKGYNLSISDNATTVLWGSHFGSGPSAMAVERQPEYASDVALSGVILTNFMPNLQKTIEYVNGKYGAAFIPPLLVGLSREYPEFNDTFINTMRNNSTFNMSFETCLDENIDYFANQNVLVRWNNALQLFNKTGVSKIMSNLTCGYNALSAPARLYVETTKDWLIENTSIDRALRSYCEKNSSTLEYVKVLDIVADESEIFYESSFRKALHSDSWTDDPLNWIAAQFSNTRHQSNCTIRTTWFNPPDSETPTSLPTSPSTSSQTSTPENMAVLSYTPTVLSTVFGFIFAFV